VLHAWLARLGWLGEPGGVPERATLLAVGRGCAPAATGTWLEAQLADLEQTLQTDAVRRRLSRPAGLEPGVDLDLWRERRFAVVIGGALWSGVFDRVVVYRRGGAVLGADLIDFKTDAIAAGEAAAAAAGYRAQLEAYRRSLAVLLGPEPIPLRSYLLFVTAGVEVELSRGVSDAPEGEAKGS
jgi:hypothetical protein